MSDEKNETITNKTRLFSTEGKKLTGKDHTRSDNNKIITRKIIISKGKKITNKSKTFSNVGKHISGDVETISDRDIKYMSLRKTKFHSRVKSAYHISRKPLIDDYFGEFLDDYSDDVINKKKVLDYKIIDKYFYSIDKKYCICGNIYKKYDVDCRCSNLTKINNSYYKIQCHKPIKIKQNTKKIIKNKLSRLKNSNDDLYERNYLLKIDNKFRTFLRLKQRDEIYYILECDKFSCDSIIEKYLLKELSHNIFPILETGVCRRLLSKNYKLIPAPEHLIDDNEYFSNLSIFLKEIKKKIQQDTKDRQNSGKLFKMQEKDKEKIMKIKQYYKLYNFGLYEYYNGLHFLIDLINIFDNNENIVTSFPLPQFVKNLDIDTKDRQYLVIINFLLQCVLILGHLQNGIYEFSHGEYFAENLYIKPVDKKITPFFEYNISGHKIRVKNLGFAVLIANFTKSSITITSNIFENKYRLVSPDTTKYSSINKYVKLVYNNNDPLNSIIAKSDIDLYLFFLDLMSYCEIRQYFINMRINKTIMVFIPGMVINSIFNSINKCNVNKYNFGRYNILNDFILVDSLKKYSDKTHEKIKPIFNNDYMKTLELLNYRLVK
jgi:hypothetical protein